MCIKQVRLLVYIRFARAANRNCGWLCRKRRRGIVSLAPLSRQLRNMKISRHLRGSNENVLLVKQILLFRVKSNRRRFLSQFLIKNSKRLALFRCEPFELN
jgi:hypothetical protein